ncbi:MAG: serine hydrolase [Gammaproteobacteria bacterium]
MIYRNRFLTVAALASCAFSIGAFAIDTDGDGIDDPFDNCIEQANADQRDTNNDGYGNLCDPDFNDDLNVNVIDLGYMRNVFFSNDPDADLNGDGSINFVDLGILRSFFFQPPGPAGEEATPTAVDPDQPPQVTAELRVIDGCPFPDGGFGHNVTVAWDSQDIRGAANVDITAIPASGMPILAIGTSVPGNASFDVNDPYGGPLQVTVFIQGNSGQTAATTVTTTLTPCLDRPIIPPGIGFQPPPVNEPPVIGTPNGIADEIDVINLGGSPFGPVEPRAIAAAGTGAGFKLFSYRIDFNTDTPSLISEVGPFAGLDVKLHALETPPHTFSEIVPFVAGVRREGNLWLRSWQLVSGDVFKDFSSVGYGENADVDVEAYAIAHRVLDNGHFQLVTPVRTARGHLRTITWTVNRQSGQVSGIQDSGDWGEPSGSTELSIAHLDESLYVISYRNAQGVLTSRYWRVFENGTPVQSGGGSSGFNLRGTSTVQETITSAKVLPIGRDEFITPLARTHNQDNKFEMHVWETRRAPFTDTTAFNAYQIADNTLDQEPDDHGVVILPAPTPTNAVGANGGFLANVRAVLTDGLWEDFGGVGAGELFSQLPFFEPTSTQIASVTKVMTLLLAAEAVDSGQINLTDELTVSAAAAAVGGSQVGLEEGEVQTLRTMLYAMMLVSGNDASAAIAEHIAGSSAAFADLMDARATQLGLTNTSHPQTSPPEGASAGGGLSTPQDQITLWRFANQDPLFREVAAARQYSACGEDAEGDEKCYFLDKFGDGNYVGQEGWKGGNGGFWIPGYSDNGGPFCVGSGCLISQVTRMDRPMHVAIQQSGDRWGDHNEMISYGYRMQYTPDHRGDEFTLARISEFATDDVGDSMQIVATIADDRTLPQICTYSTFTDLGHIDPIGCTDLQLTGVAGSADSAVATAIDGSRISTFLVEGDYFTGHIDALSRLKLNLWRVAPTEP